MSYVIGKNIPKIAIKSIGYLYELFVTALLQCCDCYRVVIKVNIKKPKSFCSSYILTLLKQGFLVPAMSKANERPNVSTS